MSGIKCDECLSEEFCLLDQAVAIHFPQVRLSLVKVEEIACCGLYLVERRLLKRVLLASLDHIESEAWVLLYGVQIKIVVDRVVIDERVQPVDTTITASADASLIQFVGREIVVLQYLLSGK